MQYLVNVPQYFSEREILRREIENQSSRISAYITASVMYETPMMLLQTILLCTIGYWLADLNREPKYILFFTVLLGTGLMSWQSMVCLCSFLSNSIARVYMFCFVLLGLGTLFGGILIVKRSIALYFLPFFITSVPAVTVRTLLHNDLLCCEMMLNCTDIMQLSSSIGSLPALAMANCTKAPDTVFNLGGAALLFLDLYQENEIFNVIVLLFFLVSGRLGAIGIFKLKCYLQYKLKNITSVDITTAIKAADVVN